MIEVQCTSCHTRYRIDEQVLPEGTPTFKCSRCGHVFTFEPRKTKTRRDEQAQANPSKPSSATRPPTDLSHSPGSRSAAAGRPRVVAPPADDQSPSKPPVDMVAEEAAIARGELPSASSPAVEAEATNPAAEFRRSAESSPPESDRPSQPEHSEPSQLESSRPPRAAKPSASAEPAIAQQAQAEQAEESPSRSDGEKQPERNPRNPSFDFTDEQPALDEAKFTEQQRPAQPSPAPAIADESDKWEVGEDEPAVTSAAAVARGATFTRDAPFVSSAAAARPRGKAPDAKGRRQPQFIADQEFVDEDEAPVYNRALAHSARMFLLLFLLLGIGFGAATIVIHNAPVSAEMVLGHLPFIGTRFVRPVSPAHLVRLGRVSANYQQSKDGHRALVIRGTAANIGTQALRVVRLAVVLRGSDRRSRASQAVYCGNDLATGMVNQMSPHEIEFFQKLQPPQTFTLRPSATCPFVVVFIDPPPGFVGYDVSVAQAIPIPTATASEPVS